MAYQALYRKYRPKNFEEVVGQRQIIQTLQNAINKNRIAHAYLFSGPRGTGKTSIAKIFARTLNCTGENKPCEQCTNCIDALSGSHPDIIEIDAASNNGVDEVRRIIERISYSPMEGKFKVYIIDEVHMMSSGAFNALLKTIEEPPEDVIFIFATTEPNKVLPTILSRCQRFDFSKVSDRDIVFRLKQVCDAEGIKIEEEGLSLIASLADGGMRDSLSILDQCASYAGEDEITTSLIREIYGVVTIQDIGEIFSNLTIEHGNEAVQQLQSISHQGMDLKRLTADLISLLKDSLLFHISEKTELISDNRKKVIQKYFQESPIEKRKAVLQDLMEIYNKYSYASSVLEYLEATLLKAVYWKEEKNVLNSYDHSEIHIPRPHPASIMQKSVAKPQKTFQNRLSMPKNSPTFSSVVSRETEEKSEIEHLNSMIDDEMLLGLLVNGQKEKRNQLSGHMTGISKYMNDLNFAKYAIALQNSQIVAAGENFLLMSSPTELEAEAINELEDQSGFEKFTSEAFQEPLRVFAISMAKEKVLKEEFRRRHSTKTLPKPYKVELKLSSNNQNMVIEENMNDDLIQMLFPGIEVVDD